MLTRIQNLINLAANEHVNLYQLAKKDFLDISINPSLTKRTFDCLVKANENFYFVNALFSARGQQYALLEKVILQPNLIRFNCSDNFSFNMSRIYPVQTIRSQQFSVLELDQIQKNVAFVSLPNNLVQKFSYQHFILDL